MLFIMAYNIVASDTNTLEKSRTVDICDLLIQVSVSFLLSNNNFSKIKDTTCLV